MTLQSLGEDYVWIGNGGVWIEFARMACDFCGAEIAAERGEIVEAVIFDGWSADARLDRHMCPDCRRRASTPPEAP